MHEMQTIVTDVHGVCLSVSLSVCHAASLLSASLCGGHLVQPLPNHFGFLFCMSSFFCPHKCAVCASVHLPVCDGLP